MRTYARLYNPDRTYTWVTVQTDANGQSGYVWLNTLIQCFKLNINESPFYANYGIPSAQAVQQQVAPDSYIANLQALFAQYFASLLITRSPSPANDRTPRYLVNVTFLDGTALQVDSLDGEIVEP